MVTRLAWVTDIHLNFLSDERIGAFLSALKATGADALLLGGDISESDRVAHHLELIARELERPIYFVLGNHDFYRGSIRDVRGAIAALSERSPWLRWLPRAGVVEISSQTALVGCDGWADGRCGDFEGSGVMLNDYLVIRELAGLSKQQLLERLHALGDEWADYVRKVLPRALEKFPRVLFLTHVPPFRDSCWYEGRVSDDDWLPHFTCRAVGEAIIESLAPHPDRRITVLCGHTHGSGFAEIRPNLEVHTGGAEYGAPHIQDVITVE